MAPVALADGSLMFILYSLVIGLALGLALRGRLGGLADLSFRWSPVILLGLVVQVVLFSPQVADRVGAWGPPLYVGSTALVFAAVARNYAVRGVPVVLLGAGSNLAAIVSNGGYMPASPAALAAVHQGPLSGYSNSSVVPSPALAPLTDIFALPVWLPFANVFSVGDVLIGAGVAAVIVLAMRRKIAPAASLGERATRA
jgi:hypothetical protein